MALAPLKQFGITRVVATTMQAISGAGYPGVASMDINANVIPFIGGEEEKMQQETQKILGDFTGDSIRAAGRESQRALQSRAGGGRPHGGRQRRAGTQAGLEDDASERYRQFPQRAAGAQAAERAAAAGASIWTENDRPQPRRDVERERGMAVFVGRVRECPVLDYKFIALGHNTIRGAAGAAVLNAELMYSEGLLD